MDKAQSLDWWTRERSKILRKVDPYLKRRPDWKSENEAKDKPLSKVTPEEATANLTRLVSEYPGRPVVLSEEALSSSFTAYPRHSGEGR